MRINNKIFVFFFVCLLSVITSELLIAAEKMYNINTGRVNIRASSTTRSKIIGKLSANERVDVHEIKNKWAKVTFKGKTGYVYAKFLGKERLEWYEGGTLHNKNALAWQVASQRNKLATCADFVTNMWQKKMLKPSIEKNIVSLDDIKPLAKKLVVALDIAFQKTHNEDDNRKIYTNQRVTDAVVVIAITAGWFK